MSTGLIGNLNQIGGLENTYHLLKWDDVKLKQNKNTQNKEAGRLYAELLSLVDDI